MLLSVIIHSKKCCIASIALHRINGAGNKRSHGLRLMVGEPLAAGLCGPWAAAHVALPQQKLPNKIFN
jgi:hypothetical protein